MNKLIGSLIVSGAMVCLVMVRCTPVSPEDSSESEMTLLRLSLEEPGRSIAEFSGAPIQAIIELDRDTVFDVLKWNTGEGYPIFSDTLFGTKAKKFTVPLYWMKYPLYKDTSDDNFYDTVWVSIGGAYKKSNKVRVRVTNLPVIIDSASFDSLNFLGQDTVWSCSLPEILDSVYALRIYAHDPDGSIPKLQVLSSKGRIIQNVTDGLQLKYYPLRGDFTDTVSMVIFDQKRGQEIRKIVLTHSTTNIFPFIDSIRVGSVMLRGTPLASGGYRAGITAFDTLKLIVYAHDSLGSIKTVHWKSTGNLLVPDSVATTRATFICTTGCSDSLTDTALLVSKITVTVIDNRGDSTQRRVDIYHGTVNQQPGITALFYNGKQVTFVDTLGTAIATGGQEYQISITASDPEDDSLVIKWSGSSSARLSSATDSSVLYRAPAVLDTDMIRVTVTDGELTVFKVVRVIVNDLAPVFESFKVNDTLLKGSDSVFTVEVVAGETLAVIINARDLDEKNDSLVFDWDAGKPERIERKLSSGLKYILPADDLNDTIIAIMQDGSVQVVRMIACVPVNLPPVVDSILGDGARLIGNRMFMWDTATAGDTVDYKIFAHDPENDAMTFTWITADENSISDTVGGEIEYFCIDSLFNDTITVMSEDQRGKTATTKIYLFIDTVTTQ